jgi:glycerophosphoryl diester phosphodiesterase
MALSERLEATIAQRGYLRSAHRGAPSFGIDNSDRAIAAALEHAPDLIEVDAHRTADDGLILWHDEHVNNHGQRLEIARTRLQTLLDVRLEDGSKLLTLEGALELTRGRAGLLIDLKAPRLETLIANNLRRANAEDALVCGGYWNTLRALKAAGVAVSYTPDPLRALFGTRLTWHEDWDALTVYHRTVTKAMLERANARGLRVIAWTVDDPARMRELIALGVHGITTNRIETLSTLESTAATPSEAR